MTSPSASAIPAIVEKYENDVLAEWITQQIAAVTVQGKPAVIWTDVPAGSGARLIDAAKVRLTEK